MKTYGDMLSFEAMTLRANAGNGWILIVTSPEPEGLIVKPDIEHNIGLREGRVLAVGYPSTDSSYSLQNTVGAQALFNCASAQRLAKCSATGHELLAIRYDSLIKWESAK